MQGRELIRTRWCLLIGVLLIISGCRDAMVNAFAFYPERLPPEAAAPSDAEELILNTPDGEQLQALWFDAQSDRTVLYLHGNAGHLFYRIDDARKIAAIGVNVLLLSYRGYGKSSGSPSEQGLYTDAQTALDYLLTERGFEEQDLFIYGRSLGSAMAVHIAQHRQLAGLVLVTPFSSGNDMAKVMGMGWLNWALGSPLDSIHKVPNVPAPALFIHGDADDIVPFALGQKLYDAYPGAENSHKRFIAVPGADHNDLSVIAYPDYWYWIEAFMAEVSESGAKS
ncbi:alpha/beta hydrolase [Corallincola luteus]|uniref:Alpha/beta hydrolase n=1 Tax=Corallincola luteus TaxID=1775177 RepID=A0ABY2AL92_9GAMM|nr:alpha/beta hydrolase [Corallincola luteus]TCI02009.1 alpha/beta hydrolase [Corallincola luteus]